MQHEDPRAHAERPVAGRRHAFPSATPRPASTAPGSAAALAHIPDKLYFRIGEVARLCDVQSYVLRFWETEFPQLRPNKGGTGQRLFRRRDVEMALRIRHLLYDEGYTIPGARQLLKAEVKPRDLQLALAEDVTAQQSRRDRLGVLYRELSELHALLSAKPLDPLRSSPAPHPTRERRTTSPWRSPLAVSLFDTLEPSPETPPGSTAS